MTYIMPFQHGSRLSWNRDFLTLDDKTGDVSSVRLNLLQRILRITLAALASLVGISAFYANTILTQKRITPFEQTKTRGVAENIRELVLCLNALGKKITFEKPVFNDTKMIIDTREANVGPLPFFPFFIPSEIAEHILDFFEDKTLARMREVSQTWNQFIQGIPSYLNRLAARSCHSEVKNANILDDIRISTEIQRIEALYASLDIESAIVKGLTVQPGYLRSKILLDIVSIQAQYDISAAKNIVKDVVKASFSQRWKIKALSRIFKIAPPGPDVIIRFVNKSPYLIMGEGKFPIEFFKTLEYPTLIKNIKSISSDAFGCRDTREFYLQPLVPALALYDIPAAIKTALMIQQSNYRNRIFVNVVRILAQCNMPEAKKIALTLVDDLLYQSLALKEIVRVEAQDDVIAAKATALTIKDARIQFEALLKILQVVSKKDILAGKAFARSFQNPQYRARALLAAAKIALLQHIHTELTKKTKGRSNREEDIYYQNRDS